MTAYCKDREYHFNIAYTEKESDLFRAFTTDLAIARKKDPAGAGQKKKDIYDKTIENVLGIKIEN
jgi:hypothetical protein